MCRGIAVLISKKLPSEIFFDLAISEHEGIFFLANVGPSTSNQYYRFEYFPKTDLLKPDVGLEQQPDYIEISETLVQAALSKIHETLAMNYNSDMLYNFMEACHSKWSLARFGRNMPILEGIEEPLWKIGYIIETEIKRKLIIQNSDYEGWDQEQQQQVSWDDEILGRIVAGKMTVNYVEFWVRVHDLIKTVIWMHSKYLRENTKPPTMSVIGEPEEDEDWEEEDLEEEDLDEEDLDEDDDTNYIDGDS